MTEFRRVMVVEDDPDIAFGLASLLDLEGYAVESAGNGLEALRMMEQKGPPDLILLDMKMPVMGGEEFAAEFNKRFHHPTPIIVMTATHDVDQRAGDIRAAGWVEKPFSFESLLSMIKRCEQ